MASGILARETAHLVFRDPPMFRVLAVATATLRRLLWIVLGIAIASTAIVILSVQDRASDAARNLMKFFSEESCGQCTPCRVGTAKALTLMERASWDQPLLKELSQAMVDASICGLGQAAPNPIACVVKYFPNELA